VEERVRKENGRAGSQQTGSGVNRGSRCTSENALTCVPRRPKVGRGDYDRLFQKYRRFEAGIYVSCLCVWVLVVATVILAASQ